MRSPNRGRLAFIALAAAVVFLGIEAIELVLAAQTLPGPLRFAALHSVGAVVFGVLSVLAAIAAVLLSRRWQVLLVGVCIAVAAIALLLV